MRQDVITETRETHAEGGEPQVAGRQGKLTWEMPRMEDVSEQVMAQPYIRFT